MSSNANAKQKVERAAMETADEIAHGAETAGEMAEQAGETVGHRIAEAGHRVRDAVSRAGHVVGDKAERVSGVARDSYRRGKDTVMHWEEGVEGFVAERPLSSLMIAAGVGIIIGFMVRSTPMPRRWRHG